MDRGSSGEGVGDLSDRFFMLYERLVLDQLSRMTSSTSFSRLDPFLASCRVNFFTCEVPSDGVKGIFYLTSCSAAHGFYGI